MRSDAVLYKRETSLGLFVTNHHPDAGGREVPARSSSGPRTVVVVLFGGEFGDIDLVLCRRERRWPCSGLLIPESCTNRSSDARFWQFVHFKCCRYVY